MSSEELDSINIHVKQQLIINYAFYKGMERKSNYRYKAIVETTLYLTLIQSDLINSVVKLTKSSTELERKFYARILAMFIYEYLKDLSSILGKELTENLKAINYVDPIEEIKMLNKQFSIYRKSHLELFKNIRHKTTAHKSRNRIELVETIFDLNVNQVEDIAADLIILNTKLTKVSSNIFRHIADFHKQFGALE